MIKRILKHKQLYVFTLLLIYCVSLSPLFLFHTHDHIEHHNHSSHCDSTHEKLDIHKDCSHDKHFADLKERCSVCDYFAAPKYEFLFNFTESISKLNLSKYSQFCESVYLQEHTTYPNKSPPALT